MNFDISLKSGLQNYTHKMIVVVIYLNILS